MISPDDLENADRICHILPRNTNFAVQGATSIDLFVADIIAHSRHENIVVAKANGPALPARRLVMMPEFGFDQSNRQMQFIGQTIRKCRFKTIIVQQHGPSALRINQLASAPVVLQRHNFVKAREETGFLTRLFKARRTHLMNQLGGVFFVSDVLLHGFERDWPDVTIPRAIIHNGIDPTNWQPAFVRTNNILVVGRAVPEKGILEAATAIAKVLPNCPDWRATFVLSEPRHNPAYFDLVAQALAPLGQQVTILQNQPFAAVQSLCETAAIAIIASKWQEPFGRTCLEAHAGGAAVLSSGTGGLKEISGDAALYANPQNIAALAEGLEKLVSDAAKRNDLARAGLARVNARFSLQQIASRFDAECEAIGAKFYAKGAGQFPGT